MLSVVIGLQRASSCGPLMSLLQHCKRANTFASARIPCLTSEARATCVSVSRQSSLG